MFCRLTAWTLTTLLLWGLSLPQKATAQSSLSDTLDVSALAEELLDEEDGTKAAYEALLDLLLRLRDEPVNLNEASVRELLALPWFTPEMAHRLVNYRETEGPLHTFLALQEILGWDEAMINQFAPFIQLGAMGEQPETGEPSPPLRVDLMQRFTRRLDLPRGYLEREAPTYYVGSPERVYTRLRARRSGRFAFNLTLDKSPGEPFRWEPRSSTFGFDHVAMHLALEDIGPAERLILGDFSTEFGQGLTLWRRMSFGKGRNAVSGLRKNPQGLRPYGSTDAVSFFRGAGVRLRLADQITASLFASRRKHDATLDTLMVDGQEHIRAVSLPQSGLRRTPNELARKHVLGESVAGADLQYQTPRAHLGLLGYHARYDHPIQHGTQAYQRFAFGGRQATMLGVYGDLFFRRTTLFGEVARAPSGAIGAIIGSTLTIGRNAEFALLGRHYPADFHGRFGTGFGEQSGGPQNEQGLYAGLRLQPARNWVLQGYFDQFHFPWLRFSVPRPTSGHEGRLLVEHQPYDWLNGYVELRTKTQERGVDIIDADNRTLQGVRREVRQSSRLHIRYRFSSKLRLQSRLAFSRYRLAGQHWDVGTLLYADLRYQPSPVIRIDARLTFFDTQSYEARLYAFENDLLYAFSLPPLFGTGQRGYLLLTFSPSSRVRLDVKYAETLYRGVTSFGSGLNETEGNQLRELRAQVRFQF